MTVLIFRKRERESERVKSVGDGIFVPVKKELSRIWH